MRRALLLQLQLQLLLLLFGCAHATRHWAADVQPASLQTVIVTGNLGDRIRDKYGEKLKSISPPVVEKMNSQLALTEATPERVCFFLEVYRALDPEQTYADNPYKKVRFELDTSEGVVGKKPVLGEIRAEIVEVAVEYLYSDAPPTPYQVKERYNHASLSICFSEPKPLLSPRTRWIQLMVRGWDTEMFRFNFSGARAP